MMRDVTTQKRQYEARLEERQCWLDAESLREAIGDTWARRLLQLMPDDARRTGHPVPSRLSEDVVEALVDCGATEVVDGRPRLTFAGKYILLYIDHQLQGRNIIGQECE